MEDGIFEDDTFDEARTPGKLRRAVASSICSERIFVHTSGQEININRLHERAQ
jgi:hypothetical protein